MYILRYNDDGKVVQVENFLSKVEQSNLIYISTQTVLSLSLSLSLSVKVRISNSFEEIYRFRRHSFHSSISSMVVLVSSVIGSQGQQRRSHVAWLPCVKKKEKKKKRRRERSGTGINKKVTTNSQRGRNSQYTRW